MPGVIRNTFMGQNKTHFLFSTMSPVYLVWIQPNKEVIRFKSGMPYNRNLSMKRPAVCTVWFSLRKVFFILLVKCFFLKTSLNSVKIIVKNHFVYSQNYVSRLLLPSTVVMAKLRSTLLQHNQSPYWKMLLFSWSIQCTKPFSFSQLPIKVL